MNKNIWNTIEDKIQEYQTNYQIHEIDYID